MNSCFFIPPELKLKDGSTQNQLIGSIIYALLFEGEIIISDSIFINTYDLRTAIRHKTIKDSIVNKKIIFATRSENESFIQFSDTAAQILSRKAINPSFANEEIFKDYSSLSFIEEFGHKVPYSLEAAKKFYSQGLLKTYLENDFGKFIPRNIQNEITNIIGQKLNEDGFLTASFFEREHGIGQYLQKVTGDKFIWEKHGEFIFDTSIANYFTFIPEELSANPIYGRELSRAFDIWRDTITSDIEEIEGQLSLTSLLQPLNFIEGLLTLTFDDIAALLESDEYIAYRTSLANLKNTTSSIMEVKRSFELYKKRIDWKILEHIGVLNKEDHRLRIKLQKTKNVVSTKKMLSEHLILTFLDAFVFNATSTFKILADVYKGLRKKDETIDDSIKNIDDIETMKEKLNLPNNEYEIIQPKTFVNPIFSDTRLNYSKI